MDALGIKAQVRCLYYKKIKNEKKKKEEDSGMRLRGCNQVQSMKLERMLD